jgi:hypothetical protein
MPLTHAITNLL